MSSSRTERSVQLTSLEAGPETRRVCRASVTLTGLAGCELLAGSPLQGTSVRRIRPALFLVLHLRINSPDVVLRGDTVENILDRRHSGEHRGVLVVVFAEHIKEAVTAEVSRVGLGNMNDVRVFHISGFQNSDSGSLFNSQPCHLFIGKFPQSVALVAEILQTNPEPIG